MSKFRNEVLNNPKDCRHEVLNLKNLLSDMNPSPLIWLALFFYYGDSKTKTKWENLAGVFILIVLFCIITTFICHKISDEYTIEGEKGVPKFKDEYLDVYMFVCYRVTKVLFIKKIIRDRDIQSKLVIIGMFIFGLFA